MPWPVTDGHLAYQDLRPTQCGRWFIVMITRWAILLLWLSPALASPPDSTRHGVLVPWDLGVLFTAPRWQRIERPKVEGVTPLFFEGLPFQGHPTRVFAWLGLPASATNGPVPAMVLVHGGGGTAFEEWVRLWVGRGYAAIAMDTCGQVPVGNYGEYVHDSQGGPPGWGGFDQINGPTTNQWTYHAVADVILSHSLLRSLPEVDPERIGITGISWGGYLTCLAAGLDPRFKLAVPVYGCGFYRETVFEKNLEPLGPELAERWVNTWDPATILSDASMPFLWVTGSNDFAYPMTALQKSYRLPRGSRTLCLRLRMPHAHGGAGENPVEIQAFADSLLREGRPLPSVTATGRESHQVWATFSDPTSVVRAELNLTRDGGRWQDRNWEALPAVIHGNRVDAHLPDGTRVFYFNLYDDRGCVVSTEHEELN